MLKIAGGIILAQLIIVVASMLVMVVCRVGGNVYRFIKERSYRARDRERAKWTAGIIAGMAWLLWMLFLITLLR